MFVRKILRHSKNLLTEKIFSGKKHHIMNELVITLTMAICLKNTVLIILLPCRQVKCNVCWPSVAVKRTQFPENVHQQREVRSWRWQSRKKKSYAYVRSILPVKRNKKNTVDYCELLLRTPNETKRALCFSKSKRPNFIGQTTGKNTSQNFKLHQHISWRTLSLKSS